SWPRAGRRSRRPARSQRAGGSWRPASGSWVLSSPRFLQPLGGPARDREERRFRATDELHPERQSALAAPRGQREARDAEQRPHAAEHGIARGGKPDGCFTGSRQREDQLVIAKQPG